ncbi:tumor necrosis factor ligand superfamily member 15 [Trachinotus anak]|uniref:tumor necrosis factor ligand superfamily member 15 n=1 Tax=Trachinotus anak TaxID=443729 RepID=UPI0039F24A0D
MGEDGYSSGEAGLYLQNTSVQLLHQKKRRRRRMIVCSVVVVVLLITAAVVVRAVLGERGDESPHRQPMKQPDSHSPGTSDKQQQLTNMENPSAMLTAPRGNNTDGKYLLWESELANAYCRGGFNYSNGNLVVPREGMYRVFLQITYEGTPDPCVDELRLTNTVSSISDSYSEPIHLLSAVDTVSCSMKHWKKSLYTAGLFRLEANSRLHVTSVYPKLIVKAEQLVFFGAELLPQ